jgi:hypothetical protein
MLFAITEVADKMDGTQVLTLNAALACPTEMSSYRIITNEYNCNCASFIDHAIKGRVEHAPSDCKIVKCKVIFSE